jgi:hypothetical protein
MRAWIIIMMERKEKLTLSLPVGRKNNYLDLKTSSIFHLFI